MIARSSGVRWDKSGLFGATPVVLPVDELGPNPELVEAAKPESDMPPPELPILLPKALRVAARETAGSCPTPYGPDMPGDDVMILGGGGSPLPPEVVLVASTMVVMAVDEEASWFPVMDDIDVASR